MTKAVIFDMDGVIVDSEPIHNVIERKLFSDLGIDVPYELHKSFVGTTTKDMFSRLKEKYGLKQSIDELIELKDIRYYNHLKSMEQLPAVPGVIGLIRKLHEEGLRLAVASSAAVREIELVMETFGLADCFISRTSGEEVERGKPAPDIFLLAAGRTGVVPGECVVIEDSRNGMLAAKAAGIDIALDKLVEFAIIIRYR
jgi:HAD superfamily hydrolase (TIGR01509 family)